jgi:hypothetical protein
MKLPGFLHVGVNVLISQIKEVAGTDLAQTYGTQRPTTPAQLPASARHNFIDNRHTVSFILY